MWSGTLVLQVLMQASALMALYGRTLAGIAPHQALSVWLGCMAQCTAAHGCAIV